MAIEIKKVCDIVQENGIKCLLHGFSGSGKTYSISTIPGRVIVLSAESGLLSLKDFDHIDAIEINNIAELREAYEFLKKNDDYDTIVLDSLTEIAQQVLSHELSSNKDGRKAYGEMNEVIIKLVKAFRDIPKKNVILICQQAKVQDSEGRILYSASMPGKTLSPALSFLFDLVACLRVRKDENGEYKRAFQFEPDEIYDCKQRGGKVNAFEPADWSIIFNKIKGTNNENRSKKERS